jgi:hypothetical protein
VVETDYTMVSNSGHGLLSTGSIKLVPRYEKLVPFVVKTSWKSTGIVVNTNVICSCRDKNKDSNIYIHSKYVF